MRASWRRGLSLVEVVVAVTVLAGALFTLGIMIPRSALHLRNKGYETVATQMAEEILDATRGLDPAQVPSGRKWSMPREMSASQGDVSVPSYPDSRRQFPPAPYPADGRTPIARAFTINGQRVDVPYYLDVEVKKPASTTPPVPRTLIVTVSWREKEGGELRSFSLTSQVGQ